MAIDQRLLRLEIEKQADKVLAREVRPLVKAAFEDRKARFFETFEEDEVTQEIRGGPEAHSSVLDEGNLFSLLGFKADKQPIDTLRGYLEDNIVIYKTGGGKVKGNQIVFSTPVYFPNEAEVDKVMAANEETALAWTTRSFTSLIAKGVSGFSRYLFDPERDFSHIPSRSGPAIQATNNLRSAEARPVPYIARLLGVLKGLISSK